MEIKYYKVINDSIVQVDQEDHADNWKEKFNWINISTENRKDVVDYFKKWNLFSENNVRDFIEHPEESPLSNVFDDFLLLNIYVSKASNIYHTDYVSVIVFKDQLITISPASGDFFNKKYLSTFSLKKYASLRYFLFYILLIKILSQDNVNMSFARKRLKNLERMLANEPDELSSNYLMQCEREVNHFSDIIEDQYVGFEIMASLSSTNLQKEDIQRTNELLKGFDPLNKAVQRLEKKAESLRLEFMLIQQEKSTRKINVLTIVQAIFVPLTFVAGVYGMNFVIMPELNWQYGYLLVWLVFIGLACGLLIYFYRKGWFD